jgi:hypothetical protein
MKKEQKKKDDEQKENKRQGRIMGGRKGERHWEKKHDEEAKELGEEKRLSERSKPWCI